MIEKIADTPAQKEFLYWLIKVHERLTIILDDNISKGVDPTEDDITLLKELNHAFYSSSMAWKAPEKMDVQNVIQSELFSDNVSEK